MENSTPQSTRKTSDLSRSIFETPNVTSQSTPLLGNVSRKRKASYSEYYNVRKLSEVAESCPSTPQFCSTLNESLMNNLEKFHIENDFKEDILNNTTDLHHEETNEVSNCSRISRCDGSQILYHSVPNTPQKQIVQGNNFPKKANTSSFIKTFSQINFQSQSPLNKEAYNILYPELPPLEKQKKIITPQKNRDSLLKSGYNGSKKYGFSSSHKELFKKIISNNIIMSRILKELSTGDLYRLSQASQSLKDAILTDIEASKRYVRYMEVFHDHKENYKITPPSSPEKSDSIAEMSPGSKNYQYFWQIARGLNNNQSLIKCPNCCKASVVEYNIAYCQAVNSCGYIFCQKCNSCAFNPDDFKDKCNNLRHRNLLRDVSNSTTSDYGTDTTNSFFHSSSFNLNLSSKYDSSGVFSEAENSTPKQHVKRNLSKTFGTSTESKIKILSSNNNRNVKITTTAKPQRRASLVPLLSSKAETPRKIIEDPPSPPRTKEYLVACSKLSKRNLKRLTR